MRRSLFLISSLVVVVGVGGSAFYAGRSAVDTRPSDVPTATLQTVIARVGSVSEEGPARVVADWPRTGSILNRVAGTITSSALTLDSVFTAKAGDEIYSVDEQPVLVAEGQIPSYRSIRPGDSGRDVRQLQHLLLVQGFRSQPETGTWDDDTSSEFVRWANAVGAQWGTEPLALPLGAVVFMPHLPAGLMAPPGAVVGAMVNDGDEAAAILAEAPRFVVDLVPNTANSRDLPADLNVTVDVAGAQLSFRSTDSQDVQDSGSVYVQLAPTTLGLGCGRWCQSVPTNAPSLWPGTVEYSPRVTGIVVPVAALLVDAGGQTFVIDADSSSRIPVEVQAQVGSTAVVNGIDDGMVVQLPNASQ